jgi:hypothetical protein
MLSGHDVKVITFPSHTSGIFQMLDLSFFGAFKRAKRSLSKNPTGEAIHYEFDTFIRQIGT